MDLGLSGAACLVTGASEGMGRAAALSLAAEGARVAIAARSADTLEATAAAAHDVGAKEVVQIVGDLTDPDHAAATVQRTIDAFGTLDVLVNTVGLCEPEPAGILATDDQAWARAWDGVLMVNVRLCRLAIPHMQANGGGAIVNIAAMSARHHLPMLSHYSSLKAALAHFTKNCAREFAPDHIRSNAVMPGLIASEGVVRRLSERQAELGIDDQAMFERTNAKYHDVTWWHRFGRPEEIGDVVAFLASPRASYVNGAMVNVDGGSVF
jgi:3-oxoacyl-[acyl-carrier protein] reductase